MRHSFITKVRGLEKLEFDWVATQRRAMATIIPIVLMELKKDAPVSNVKPDAGRFRASIGYRIEPLTGAVKVKFVSTAPYAKYVLEPTTGGTVITPQKTLALRFRNGFGDYVFASSVVRGDTKGNDFNKKVAIKIRPLVLEAFGKSMTIVSTSD